MYYTQRLSTFLQAMDHLLLLVEFLVCATATAQTEPRLQFGTIFREKAFLSAAGTNVIHLTVGVQVPNLPPSLQHRQDPCSNSTGLIASYCREVSSLVNMSGNDARQWSAFSTLATKPMHSCPQQGCHANNKPSLASLDGR